MSGEMFEALLGPNLRGVRLLVKTQLRDFGDPDDVLQDILLRAFTHRHQLRAEEKFRSWLWSIALNELRSFFRRDRILPLLDQFPNFDVRDPAVSPLTRVEGLETREWLHGCIAKLPERDRVAIRMVDMEGRTLNEAAAALHTTVGAAKSIHFRARRRLDRMVRAGGWRRGHTSMPAAA